ncbi:glycerate kinase [Enterococcus villorum]|uniref:Glycerate kinase n=1 Tax=Enterococcus villorum TaxID=112904 RepID=A0A1V8YQN0_9ENTE|nr:glycerate kinase [Enterococcus villorum]OQO69756.1 glycerate kinase [Enterococcus villorum]OQO74919.1 glycerate kinase [Enterococcus villorum]
MRILIVPDSFKESLTAFEAAQSIQAGFKNVFPNAEYELLPVGDGGEGTVSALVDSLGLSYQTTRVSDAFGNPKMVNYATNGQTAIFEMAEIVGLKDIPFEQRNPLKLSTKGVGELMYHLLKKGIRQIFIGVGGSSTNDGGIGMAVGLGYKFFDQNGQMVEALGENLKKITAMDKSEVLEELTNAEITVITDVTNPLCGKEGASFVFGPQKGLKANELAEVDQSLYKFYTKFAPQVMNEAGSGAGGGMGAGLLAFASGKTVSGIDYVLDLLSFDQRAQQADLVIVGEGRMDGQSIKGKAPVGIARRVPSGVPVVAICGSVGKNMDQLADYGISAVFPIIPGISTLDEALKQASDNLQRTAKMIAALLHAVHFQGGVR